MDTSMIIGFIGIFVALSFIYFGIRNYRNNISEGTISFGKAFQIGLYISLVASTMYVLTWMIYYQAGMGSDFMEIYLEQGIEKIQSSDLSDAEKDSQISQLKMETDSYHNSPLIRVLYTYVEILPWGIIISLICAAILRKKPAVD